VRIAVCLPQVPFARGGAEILAETLVSELKRRDHEAELLTIPFKWYPGARVLSQALLWRLLDVEEAEGRPIDLVIATKFPSYAVSHRNKVVWLVHQFRQAYDFDLTEFRQFRAEPFDRATRRAVHRLDSLALGEARRRFAISRNVADRLRDSTGLDAEVLPPPPQSLEFRCDDYGDYVLSVGRLDRTKRVELLLEGVASRNGFRAVVVGDGPERKPLERLSARLGLGGRVRFAGRVEQDELADLYARCLAVYYAPVDEDFGFVPYEAFLSEKPVITTSDSGGPLEVVSDGENGIVCEPSPVAVAEACAWLAEHPAEARARGRSGKRRAEAVTWNTVVDRLLGA
jgi:glycosyltransferase involved in cell wall biosynthesis